MPYMDVYNDEIQYIWDTLRAYMDTYNDESRTLITGDSHKGGMTSNHDIWQQTWQRIYWYKNWQRWANVIWQPILCVLSLRW